MAKTASGPPSKPRNSSKVRDTRSTHFMCDAERPEQAGALTFGVGGWAYEFKLISHRSSVAAVAAGTASI
jgi:hypothetical protein